MKEWRLDDDPLTSARILLSRASIGVGSEEEGGRVRLINIEPNVDYDSLAFSIPEILMEWANRINEVVMDSACK